MRVGLIGAGNMARALARGWGDPVLASDAGSGRARTLAEELGGEALDSNAAVAERADVVVLCHKPAQLATVAGEIAGTAKVVISVLGGTSVSALEEVYPDTPVVRAMPNTPVEVKRGVVAYATGSRVSEELARNVHELFERLGTSLAAPDGLIDAISAVSGVGPAYHALLVEAQVDAAIRYGLSGPLAGRLVSETMAGTAALLAERDYDTLAVRREVTSPGGGTARGLEALERAGVRSAFQAAFDAVAGWSRR